MVVINFHRTRIIAALRVMHQYALNIFAKVALRKMLLL